MERRIGWADLLLPLVALGPACLVARCWPSPVLSDLPALVLPLYAAYRLAMTCGRRPEHAFVLALSATGALWVGGTVVAPTAVSTALVLAGALLCGAWWSAARHDGPARWRAMLATVAAGGLAACAGALLLPHSPAGTRPVTAPAEQRPVMFIPLEVDPTGQRLAVFSLRDREDPGDGTFALWTLDLTSGQPHPTYRGFPLYLTSWSPDGRSLAFMASQRSWEEQPEPFGIFTAPFGGGGQRQVLAAPSDGTTWYLPAWSRQGNRISAWRLRGGSDGEAAQSDLPRSFVVPSGGGEPREIRIRGCRLALLSAWDHQSPAGYCLTERGLFRVTMDGGAKRLVPSGEAPLDPFPFVTADGPSPDGQHLAYLELLFKRGEIDRIDLGLCDLRGRRRSVLRGLYPVAYGWDPRGGTLAAGQVDKRRQVKLLLSDMGGGRQWVRTGLTLGSTEYPMRIQAAPGGRYWALDGQFTDAESWDVAIFDRETGKTILVDAAHNHLAAGWRADGKLVLSTLSGVAVVNADGSGYTPIYGQAGARASVLAGAAWRTRNPGLTIWRDALQRVRPLP